MIIRMSEIGLRIFIFQCYIIAVGETARDSLRRAPQAVHIHVMSSVSRAVRHESEC